jgi:phytoene dehydrogenase-like protein
MTQKLESTDVAIVGGGLAGLATAALLGRAGRRVTLFERSSTIGGRAVTHREHGFQLNLGPHALYNGGPAEEVLRALGVRYSGRKPGASGAVGFYEGQAHALPGGFFSLLTTSLFGVSAKLETGRLLGTLAKVDPQPLQSTSVSEWLRSQIRHPEVRALVSALVRVATYTNDPDRMSAGTAIAQVQGALGGGVSYLDGGWQSLVDGLVDAATRAGVTIRSATRVSRIEANGSAPVIHLADGAPLACNSVVIAASPSVAAEMVPGSAQLARWAAGAIPVRAACLDLGLSRLPRPRARFALGIDQPTYFSVHSAYAALAPNDGAMIHVAKYLPSEPTDAKQDERELESVLDAMQPGWREAVVTRRYLPSMIAANALPAAVTGGVRGRPGPALEDVRNVYIAGDWVGPVGHLADACFASARRATELILEQKQAADAVAA